nr:hypothetical protein GCM10025732_00950 [Glycomyces mayteni]
MARAGAGDGPRGHRETREGRGSRGDEPLSRGFFTDPTPAAIADNKQAIDEAAEVGAPTLVLVSGGIPDGGTIDTAREGVKDALDQLAPYALAQGVTLAIEPLHPMFASDRCVVATLAEALDLAAPFAPEAVGVVVDTYHLWWDPQVWQGIARAGREGRIASFQFADWITPSPRASSPAEANSATAASTSSATSPKSTPPASPAPSKWNSSTTPSGPAPDPRSSKRRKRPSSASRRDRMRWCARGFASGAPTCPRT